MKMPSTYISLLLLCGLMLIFHVTQKRIHTLQKPGISRPMVKAGRPLVKRFSPDSMIAVPLNKNNSDENVLRQTRLTERSFSFIRDVIGHIVPVLKNVE